MATFSQKKKKYEHILWDWNGTLLDDVDLCIDTINVLLKEYKLPFLSKEKYRNIVDFPIVNYYLRLGFIFKEKSFEEVGSEFMELYRAKWRDCRLQPDAEKVLDKAGITINKNTIPYDPQKPFIASGIRLGTPALTTRGMKEVQMETIAQMIAEAIEHKDDENYLNKITEDVKRLCKQFPLYKERLIKGI